MIIVSDTSPVSNLILIDQLELLKEIFGTIVIPPAVDLEIKALSNFSVPLEKYEQSKWIRIVHPTDKNAVLHFQADVDEGESEAIVLAKELKADYLLIDERLGNRVATEQGLQTVGLLGVLVKAKQKGVIQKVEPIVDDLMKIAGFWISDLLLNRLLKQVGER